MTNEKKAIDIYGINCSSLTLDEYGDNAVGDKFTCALIFSATQMELSQSMTKSIRKLDINLYEGVGKIFTIDNYAYKTVFMFDCGIYAYSTSYEGLPKGIKSGSYVKMRFYLIFDDRAWQLTINDEPLLSVIPDMQYDWEIKDILIYAKVGEKGEKYFEDLPVAHVSPEGEIFKRIKKTNFGVDCGGSYLNDYILLCEMK